MEKGIITEDFFDKLHKNTFWIYSKVVSGLLMIPTIFIGIIDELDLVPYLEVLPKLGMSFFYLSISYLWVCLVSIIIKEITLVKIRNKIKECFAERDYGFMILFIVGAFIIGLGCFRFFQSLLYICFFINVILN